MNYANVLTSGLTFGRRWRVAPPGNRTNGYMVIAEDNGVRTTEVAAFVDDSGWMVTWGGFAGDPRRRTARHAATLEHVVPDGYKATVQRLMNDVSKALAVVHGW